MFSSKEAPTNTRLILVGLFFIAIFTYTISRFFQEHEIADPSLSHSPEIIFHTSRKTEASSEKKQFFSHKDPSQTMKPKGIKIPPRPTSKAKGLSDSEIRDAQRVAHSISGYKNLESAFTNEYHNNYNKMVRARKKKARKKIQAWQKRRIRAGYPDPLRKRKRKRKTKRKRKEKTNEQIMKETYREYIKEKGKALLKKSKPYIIPPPKRVIPFK